MNGRFIVILKSILLKQRGDKVNGISSSRSDPRHSLSILSVSRSNNQTGKMSLFSCLTLIITKPTILQSCISESKMNKQSQKEKSPFIVILFSTERYSALLTECLLCCFYSFLAFGDKVLCGLKRKCGFIYKHRIRQKIFSYKKMINIFDVT